jgi:hypothetical protein
MNGKIEQKDINNAAWAACDTFRGVVDPAMYKDYILVMLFVKYISDVWKDTRRILPAIRRRRSPHTGKHGSGIRSPYAVKRRDRRGRRQIS